MRILALLAAAGFASAASAQTPSPSQRYDPAPWWMNQPVIAALGNARTETPANRAQFTASFQSIDRDRERALVAARERVRSLGQALASYGPERVRVQSSIYLQPLYEQYRDRQGQVQENQRADQVARWAASASFSIAVRDLSVLQRVYATVVDARPTSTTPVYFHIEVDPAMQADLEAQAVRDAARRARLAAEAAGTRLGTARVIDPTSRVCHSNVLTQRFGPGGGGDSADEGVVVTGSRASRAFAPPPPAPPPPPPPPPVEAPMAQGAAAESVDTGLPLQPPLQTLSTQACVVYSLG